MVQVLKEEVRARIEVAALGCFAHDGYVGTTMARIARCADTAPANVYRYYANKRALLEAVVPGDLVVEHDRLLNARVVALGRGSSGAAAEQLLDFWLGRRHAVVVLLDRAEGTPYADYPATFVERLVTHTEQTLDRPLAGTHREILTLVFDNTRRAIAQILLRARSEREARDLVAAFWSYQLPGLDGLLAHLAVSAQYLTEGSQAVPPSVAQA